MIALLAIAVFVAAAALDYATVAYYRAVARGVQHAAARWSVAMYLIGAVGLLSIVEVSLWLILPECLGLYAGTLVAMRRGPDLA